MLRDIARAMGFPFAEADQVAKLVPEVLQHHPEATAIEKEPRLKEMIDKPTVLGTLEGERESPPRSCSTSPWRWRA